MHLKGVYKDGELNETSTTKDFLVVQTEGNRDISRSIKHYNLDAIISARTQWYHVKNFPPKLCNKAHFFKLSNIIFYDIIN